MRRVIAAVAQKSGVDRDATGRENVMLQGRLYGMEVGGLKERTNELLNAFGLGEAADRVVRTYSGGMQRRLDVAIGLVTVRHIRALLRQPWWIAISLVQPIIWLLLFGALFRRIVELPGFETESYITFLTPGIVIMSAMFSGGWSGMGCSRTSTATWSTGCW